MSNSLINPPPSSLHPCHSTETVLVRGLQGNMRFSSSQWLPSCQINGEVSAPCFSEAPDAVIPSHLLTFSSYVLPGHSFSFVFSQLRLLQRLPLPPGSRLNVGASRGLVLGPLSHLSFSPQVISSSHMALNTNADDSTTHFKPHLLCTQMPVRSWSAQ